MAYNEHIYIQKEGNGYPCYDVAEEFELFCSEIPFEIGREAKDVYTNSWNDEDGDEEYIPEEIKIKSYEMKVGFLYKGDRLSANSVLKKFRDYLTGRDGTGASFMMYSTYTGIGRRNIRFISIDNEATLVRNTNVDCLSIKINLKVNDPVTDICYNATSKKLIEENV